MRIRQIIYESTVLPLKKYKQFLLVIILAVSCELISEGFYDLPAGQWKIITIVLNSVITLIILGVMMNITYNVIFDEKIEVNIKDNLIEGIKEYLITMYYLLITFILSSLLIIPTGVYRRIYHIHEYLLNNDINTAFMTIHELSHQLPVSMQINLQHSIQLNLLLAIVIFIICSSFSFIGRIILIKTNDMKKAFNPKITLKIIENIGKLRYIKFLVCVAIIMIVMFNTNVLLEVFFKDNLISAIIEAYILFFTTNAFYQIYLS